MSRRILWLSVPLLATSAAMAAPATGRSVFDEVCAACHLGGIGGAPALRDRENWRKRLQQGEGVLVNHAINGIRAMPPRGGNAGLSDAEVAAAVKYMVRKAAR